MRYPLIKSILSGILLPMIFLWIFSSSLKSNYYRYLLLTKRSSVTNGIIINANQFEDIVEFNNDRSLAQLTSFSFEYTFIDPNGTLTKSSGIGNGELPTFLMNLSENPYPVEVEYLTANPSINQVKASWSGDQNFNDFLRHSNFIPVILILLLLLGFSIAIIKNGIKKYLSELKEYE